MTTIHGSAEFSECGRHRHRLDRWWSDKPRALVCMCNPSTAGAEVNDPTIRRLIDLLRDRDGIGGFTVVNWCDFVATDPDQMALWRMALKHENDPDEVGLSQENLSRIRRLAQAAPIRIVAWGNLVAAEDHTDRVLGALSIDGLLPLYAFGATAGGAPKHPMARGKSRIPNDAPLIVWREPTRTA